MKLRTLLIFITKIVVMHEMTTTIIAAIATTTTANISTATVYDAFGNLFSFAFGSLGPERVEGPEKPVGLPRTGSYV